MTSSHEKKKRVICFGPGPHFKGGLSDYNVSLAKALESTELADVEIVSWTEQYPSIVPRDFKDRVSKTDHLAGTEISCQYLTNYNNPFSWRKTANYIIEQNPDIVIFQWSIAIQGLPVGQIISRIKKKSKAEVIVDLHFVVQKEQSTIDRLFTKWGIAQADTYIVHAYKTAEELEELLGSKFNFKINETGHRSRSEESKDVIKLYHPIYNLFAPQSDFDVDAFKKEHGLKDHVFLFFGFIRKYKGLHHVIPAFNLLKERREDVSLLICGESFWSTVDNSKWANRLKSMVFGLAKKLFLGKTDNEKSYNPLELISELGLEKDTVLFNRFIPNEEVHKYFQVSDAVLLFYETATPSGIESLSYNFGLPVLATRVGHFPETIKDGYNGYLAEKGDVESMAQTMQRFIENPIDKTNVTEAAKNMSWENYALAVLAYSK